MTIRNILALRSFRKRRNKIIMTHKRKQVGVKGFLRKVPGSRKKIRIHAQRRKLPK